MFTGDRGRPTAPCHHVFNMSGPRTISVPRLLRVASGAMGDLPGALAETFDLDHVLVVTGQDTSRIHGLGLVRELQGMGSRVETHPGPDGTMAGTIRSAHEASDASLSLVVGFGGGRPIDVAKMIAFRAGLDVVVVPTVLSHDGMCSPVASLVGDDGFRRSLGTATPAGVVVDTEVIQHAPLRYLRAGIGDLVSNLTAIEDWHRAAATTGEVVDEFAASIAQLSSQSSFDIDWPPSEADLAVVARALVMSGLAMAVAGSSRPCSGAEHLISHALDELLVRPSTLHGEQVAIGVLISAELQRGAHTEHIAPLFERIGFPRDLEGWGLDPATLVDAVRRAPSTRLGRYTVLDEADLSIDAVEDLVKAVFDRPRT